VGGVTSGFEWPSEAGGLCRTVLLVVTSVLLLLPAVATAQTAPAAPSSFDTYSQATTGMSAFGRGPGAPPPVPITEKSSSSNGSSVPGGSSTGKGSGPAGTGLPTPPSGMPAMGQNALLKGSLGSAAATLGLGNAGGSFRVVDEAILGPQEAARQRGRALFFSKQLGGNRTACGTCHDPAHLAPVARAYPRYNPFLREVSTLEQAQNACLSRYMRASPLPYWSRNSTALSIFLLNP